MVTYSQSSGELRSHDGVLIARCYAGQGAGLNQPGWQSVSNTGPLPVGVYTFGKLATLPRLGPCLELVPDATTRMRGRSGFFVHLDNPNHVGDSSDGCIVAPSYAVLQTLDALTERGLTVLV